MSKIIPVQGQDQLERINAAIGVADWLHADDGRTFQVQEWHPHVVVHGMVTVTARMVVRMPEENGGK